MLRAELLDKALSCVCGQRQEDYGTPEDSFDVIAKLWNVYLQTDLITARDVAAMLILLKVARISSGKPHIDSWIDIAGYAACGGEIESGV